MSDGDQIKQLANLTIQIVALSERISPAHVHLIARMLLLEVAREMAKTAA